MLLRGRSPSKKQLSNARHVKMIIADEIITVAVIIRDGTVTKVKVAISQKTPTTRKPLLRRPRLKTPAPSRRQSQTDLRKAVAATVVVSHQQIKSKRLMLSKPSSRKQSRSLSCNLLASVVSAVSLTVLCA